MRLKSEGFASSLFDPHSTFTLAHYCEQKKEPYADLGLPVRLDTFISYGLEFQKKFVPKLENRMVTSVERSAGGFRVHLEDGETVAAKRVVNSVGLSYFAHVPSLLEQLPDEFMTHSSRHCDVDRFKGRTVAVIGAGASALDLAALLHQAGASVQVVARAASIHFHDRGRVPRPLMDRMRSPTTGLGPGWKSLFCVKGPLVFRHLPERSRLEFVRRHLGPGPGWFVKDEVVGKVPLNLGVAITGAAVRNARASLELTDKTGARRTLEADHVIAATGYKVDLRRIGFLDKETLATIQSVDHTPVLSSNFECSVPGMYFVGTTAANTFGPLLRFAYGAGFTSRRLSGYLANSLPTRRAAK
jgi:cation diffusion facilitator CzcD-associated flavoprotein CzcO